MELRWQLNWCQNDAPIAYNTPEFHLHNYITIHTTHEIGATRIDPDYLTDPSQLRAALRTVNKSFLDKAILHMNYIDRRLNDLITL